MLMPRNHAADFLQFLAGAALFFAGLFLLANQVMASSTFGYRGGWWGGSLFPSGSPGLGLMLIPLGIGVCLLLQGASRRWASLLIWGSLAALAAGLLNSLRFAVLPGTLWALGLHIVMLGAGGGLMLRSLSGYADGERF